MSNTSRTSFLVKKEERSRRLEGRNKKIENLEAKKVKKIENLEAKKFEENDHKSLLSSPTVSTNEKSGKEQEAWTPIRVRKERLGLNGNLGLSPKSFKVMKIGKLSSRSKSKPRNGGDKVKDISTLFEGASGDRTLADIVPNPCRTNLLAIQNKPLGQLYRVDRCTPGAVIGQAG